MQETQKEFLERMESGYRWLKEGNLTQINNRFTESLNAGPDFVEKAFLYADYVNQIAINYHSAASIFYKLILEQRENPWPHVYCGLAFLMGSRPFPFLRVSERALEQALAHFNAAIIADRTNPVAYYARAKAHFYNADLAEALEDAKTAYRLRDNIKTTINYGKFVEYLENLLRNPDVSEFSFKIGTLHTPLRTEYDNRRGDHSDPSWILTDREHRFNFRPGDLLRQYVRPYVRPEDIFYTEHEVSAEPHFRPTLVTQYTKGLEEFIGFKDGKYMKTSWFFQHEIWIKRDGLTGWRKWLLPSPMPIFL